MLRRFIARVALCLSVCVSPLADAATCYVNAAATGGNNGTSWANAYTDLQSALGNYLNCSQFWVARGTYKPTATTDRTISFNIKPGVIIYGGFAGTEAALADRLLAANPTILSGDIGVAGDSSDNSYHVVVLDGTTASGPILPTTLLAYLTISDGNANGAGANEGSGGGLYCNGQGAGHACNPHLARIIFENNSAGSGGAIYNDGHGGGASSPSVQDTVMRNNQAANLGGGGAMYNNGNGGASNPDVDRVTFIGNNGALAGGAMFNDGTAGISSPTVSNSTFYENTAALGGAILNYGASAGHASPVLRYDTFYRNKGTGGPGGAIYNSATGGDAAPNMSGMIFWADEAVGAPVENYSIPAAALSLEYSITPECPPAAVGCINTDPMLGPLRDNGGSAPTMRPEIGSPAIDAGNALKCPADDERGITRPQGSQCDIGAVELKLSERKICYVNLFALPPIDGASWGSAYAFLPQALGDTTCNEVWVAKATYKPPIVGSDRAISFVIPPGKAVYGGFAVGATARSQRDPSANPTILSGDIGVVGDSSDNSYHVVIMDAVGAATSITNATVLDGFTITNGNANGASGNQNFGGGLICNGQAGFSCSPTLANLVFSANQAVTGGAIANLAPGGVSSPTLTSVTFSANHASDFGGAIWNDAGINGACNPVVSASWFDGNSAAVGGAIENTSASGSYTDVVFSGNAATVSAGAVHNSDELGTSSPNFSRVTFADNTATQSGGAVVNTLYPASAPHFDTVTFVGNSAHNGGAVENFGGSAIFSNVLFLGNTATSSGGAIDNFSMGKGPVTPVVDRAAFIGNTSSGLGGGAVCISGAGGDTAALTITNSTFSKNVANNGGAIVIEGATNYGASAVVRNVTFAHNSASKGGALYLVTADGQQATLTASDSIFWADGATEIVLDASLGGSTDAMIDHTLIQGGCPLNAECHTFLPTDPLLGPLQYNGGFTPTMMPAANSLALDDGANCAATDQRGVARPQGAACDIGAVERRATEDYLFNSGFDW